MPRSTVPPADPGLFGPASVTWRVHAEPVLWFGGLRALLLQALHPLAMAGVAQHSAYREDPWGRLFRTAEYVGVTTFGSTEEAERAAERVRRVHTVVRGVEPESGREYRADDPDLLAWVHCCEVDSFLSTARRAGLRLSAEEADAYVAEQVRQGALVGLAEADLPGSTTELAAYFDRVRPELRVTAAAREALWVAMLPRMPPAVALATPARPAWIGATVLAFALLPRWARRMYLLPGLPTTDLAASAALFGLRRLLAPLPIESPHYRAAKARLGLG